MVRILFAFILLLAAVYLGVQFHNDPGYVLVAIHHWTIESTLWVALAALFLLFLLLHGLLAVLRHCAKTPGAITRWYGRHLTLKAQHMTRKGLIEYSEGYWSKAKHHLIKALPHTDTPLINYLTAARAAQKMDDSALRDQYLREAQQCMPDAKIAVELTQAQLQLANHQWEQALATLKHLQDLAPRHPYVLKLLMHLYEDMRDWKQLIALLPALKKNGVIQANEYQPLLHHAYLQALVDMGKQQQTAALTAFFKARPKALRYDTPLIAEYLRYVIAQHDYASAEALLRASLQREYTEELIALYSLLPYHEKQLPFIESLLKKNPHAAPLHLCLGQLCIAQQLWGKAKFYLQESIERNPTPIAYNALGLLHDKLNEFSLAHTAYKTGLALVSKTSA